MIEKIMKAVKSGNKKRGRNITIGAVVGMLLSCTVAMGEDPPDTEEVGLNITNNGSGIKIDKVFPDNTLKGNTYTNNTEISADKTTGTERVSGIKIDGENKKTNLTLKNNGLISGKSSVERAYGIIVENLEANSKFNFINNGALLGEATSSKQGGYGIYIGSNLGSSTLVNNGLISAKGYHTTGIYVLETRIETLNNNGLILALGDDSGYGIYIHQRGFVKAIENKGLILAKNTGIFLMTLKDYGDTDTLINEGAILGAWEGIRISSGINGDASVMTNRGIISEENSAKECIGINISVGNGTNDRVGTLTNDGLISAKGTDASSGIKIRYSGRVGNLISNGLIISNKIGIRSTSGAAATNRGKIGNIVNNGAISAETYGIAAGPTDDKGGFIDKIVNTGVIYGKTNAIKKEAGTDVEGEIESTTNYGILVNGANNDVFDVSGKTLKNYGLTIKNDGAEVTVGTDTLLDEIIVGYKRTFDNEGNAKDTEIKRNLTIKNAEITGGTATSGTGTKSFEFSGGGTEYDNSILNGMNNTLKISGANVNREVKGSIINAYGNAVKFGEVGKEFTLSGTIVNGGIKKGTVAIQGSDGADTLILQSGKVEYSDKTTGSQNTIVNGDIDMGDGKNSITLKTDTIVNGSITTGKDNDTLIIESGAVSNGNIFMGDGDDTLTIGSGAIINGILNGTKDPTSTSPVPITTFASENNTLNFGTADSPSKEETRVFYDISGFENININSKVTFYEKTVKADDGTAKGLEVTGVSDLTIGKGGILTLRIDGTETNPDGSKIISHALSTGNVGTIKSEDGGKLLLALNGVGNTATVSFGDLTLDDSLKTGHEADYQRDVTLETTSVLHSVKRGTGTNNLEITARVNLPNSPNLRYEKLNKIYHSIVSVEDLLGNFNVDDEGLVLFLDYLNNIYAGSPYSYSSELSRKSAGMFRDIVVDNIFRPEKDKWMIYGGLTHVDGGTKDTYYGKGYYTADIGSSDMDADTKITGAYMLGEYGVSDTLTSGVVIGGNKLKSDLSNSSKVDGSAMYLGAYAKKYIGNLKVTAGAGFQYGDYDADRLAVNRVASDSAESVMKYSDNYNDITYDIYLNGRYSHNIGNNLFLEPYATLSYTYVDQDGANEGSKVLAIETDSKSFDYTVGKVGVDLKKVIPHEKGKSTLSAGVSYTKILDGADEEHITGRFKGGSDFDILVAHKNKHSIGLNAKYALELENGVIFDVKGTYSIERDSHNGSGKNRTKGEWIVGAGLGYKF
ncbi:autotransporter outer membrane beta-barrel domain-containing protein [Fusobacterium ulcerans]|uniref:autotransporter outer membrane beta-barrel domain-containing protein n=1 Tax=Fusobacterium ulcerans TaxID=861 RepID=UPI001D0A6130|nr:autotransporter outer membrane beta-barrel domain-containing protein [Fusobacterium ulcerans]MCB8650406.1 autotransporter outer membrane beta-barrel domain-containing protein [Fusobacterium ulcerans]